MGISEKSSSKQVKSSDAPNLHHKKWKIQVIRTSLQPIRIANNNSFEDDDNDCCSTTPTSEESRIPDKACPPPPPRKQRKTASGRGCSYGGSGATATAKEFFCPPDLDTVFIRRHVA